MKPEIIETKFHMGGGIEFCLETNVNGVVARKGWIQHSVELFFPSNKGMPKVRTRLWQGEGYDLVELEAIAELFKRSHSILKREMRKRKIKKLPVVS